MILETERLILRPIVLSDKSDLLEYHGDEEVIRYIPWTVRSSSDVETAIQAYQGLSESMARDGDSIVLGWELKGNKKLIGQSNASLLSLSNKTADIGWVMNRAFWRQGYAFEATRALLDFLLGATVVQRVIANIDIRNPESARLAEKLGMRLEGHFKQSAYTKGEWCDMWLYAKLAEEHQKGGGPFNKKKPPATISKR